MRWWVRGDGDTAARIVACEDRIAEAAAEVIPLDAGRVIRQPAFPHVFDANLVRHVRLAPAGLDDAIARLGAALAAVGARHLQLCFDDAPVSSALALGLRRRGFLCDRLLAMALHGAPARAPRPGVAVLRVPEEAPFGWFADTIDRMSRDEPWYTPAVSREIVGSLAVKADAGVLALYAATLDGRSAGAAGLAVFPGAAPGTSGVAAITTVGTVPELRRRGVAQTMVGLLAATARRTCDMVYLIARADDTPKELYRKLGFEVVFGFDVWLRPPGAAP